MPFSARIVLCSFRARLAAEIIGSDQFWPHFWISQVHIGLWDHGESHSYMLSWFWSQLILLLMTISIWNYRFYMLHRRTFLKKDLELPCFDHYPDWNTGATGYYFRNYEPAFMMNQSLTQNARSFPNKSEHTILLNKQLTPSKQHISTLRARNLKNFMRYL